jgi:Signal transduction histidine kinase
MRVEIIVSIISLIFGGYFAIRYYSLCYSFEKIIKDLIEIQGDLSQNHMLHLPIPDSHLAKLLSAFNSILEGIQIERQKYENREKEFRKQIENISHDLRTPLTVILGYIKLIRKDAIVEKQLVETLDIVQRKAEVMSKLVSQFYEFSRLKSGDYEIPIGNVDISRVLRESLLGNYQILEKANLQLEVDIPEQAIWVLGEDSVFERIFSNLFQNASRYANKYFRISIIEKEQTISILFVNDTRVLSLDEIPHLFERFYMQDSSRNQGGTGLGLTIAKSLAEEIGADLLAYSLEQESINPKIENPQICFELCMKAI